MNRNVSLVALLFVLMSLNSTEAGLINGSFESGMSSWTTVGPNSSLPNGSVNGTAATDGSFYGNLATGSGSLSATIHNLVLGGATTIPANYLTVTFPDATEGAILFQTFDLNATNNALTFDWKFLTDEFPNEPNWNDFGFALLYNNDSNSIAGTAIINTFSVSAAGSPSNYTNESAWQPVTFGSLTGGDSYTLVFGVFDDSDTFEDSALLIDGVHSIPEPSAALSVILAGILATGIRRRVEG